MKHAASHVDQKTFLDLDCMKAVRRKESSGIGIYRRRALAFLSSSV